MYVTSCGTQRREQRIRNILLPVYILLAINFPLHADTP